VDNPQTTLMAAAWKHRFLALLILGAFILVGLIFIVIQGTDRQFKAEALIVLQDPASVDGRATPQFIAEQVEIMRSPIVAESAMEHLQQESDGTGATSAELLSSIAVGSSIDSTLVFVSAVDENPERAMAIANAMAYGYQDVTELQASQSSVSALENIDAQITSIEGRFDEVSRAIQSERDANAELSRLEQQFRESLTIIADLQVELVSASGDEAARLRSEIADHRIRIENYRQAVEVSRDSPELQALLDEQEELIARRTELLQRRDQIAIDAELAPGAVALLHPAVDAAESAQTSPTRVLAVAFALGAFSAIGVAYVLELRLRMFSDRLEPQSILGLPLLADIPSFSGESLGSRLPVREFPRSAAAESFRFAAASVEEAMRSRGVKSIMMVSSTVGHGKSTCLVNTAIAGARRGHRVLLLDCDFGTQDASRLVATSDSDTSVGLVDVVEEGVAFEEAVTNLPLGDQADLSIMGRGTRPTVAANLLLDKQFHEAFARARDDYDIVFIDGPPLLQVAYASTLANTVEALVIVVSHETPVREFEELVDRLQLIETPVLGYLYNRSPLRKEMTVREGSMRDIIQDRAPRGTDGMKRQWWQRLRV
jgi:Mrp family chromosome partitioning ATPase/capsular polysaccharide biosynthesis protein